MGKNMSDQKETMEMLQDSIAHPSGSWDLTPPMCHIW
jgi:hypothetical protein